MRPDLVADDSQHRELAHREIGGELRRHRTAHGEASAALKRPLAIRRPLALRSPQRPSRGRGRVSWPTGCGGVSQAAAVHGPMGGRRCGLGGLVVYLARAPRFWARSRMKEQPMSDEKPMGQVI